VEVGVVGRLKKWVKAVSAACKREAFSTAFAHGCEAIFKLSINCKNVWFIDIETKRLVTRINTENPYPRLDMGNPT
jgi:hypothetical protein